MIKLLEWQYYPKWHVGLQRSRNDYLGYWWYEYWVFLGPLQFRFRGGSEKILCDNCGRHCLEPEDEYGDFICKSCEENRAEASYERYVEDYYTDGSSRFKTLLDQQIAARKLK